MSSVHEIHRITEKLLNLVEKQVDPTRREDIIEQITSLLEERELFIKENEKPQNEEEKQLGKQIVIWNKIIIENLNQLKFQVQQDMVLLKKTSASTKQYANPYQDISVSDGMFYDKRK
ncbi:hypothetical protein CJ195_14485 [Bacillus sp. UMB0899]|uniref:hypothetical protein n=1 Tax=Metabacillus schmidteae TaxID=2730405 RepID=UPI000C80B589|nr:hypothetical protein [Metabacillus schmidteae]PMC36639.1 hypothetical protein CJ195_14485 [Bacillus sp. UMB0899]